MVEGHIFVMNIDDSQVTYNEVFDPDMQDFYNAACLPEIIFNLTEMKKPENYEKVLDGSMY